jgi:histidine triad (HIT) family protein
VLAATGATSFNVLQNNGAAAHQAVMHVHFHIIPRFETRPDGAGLGINWKPQKLEPAAGKALAEKIASHLQKS